MYNHAKTIERHFMSIWKRLLRVAARAESSFDTLKLKLDARLNRNAPISILTYIGHGTATMLRLHGRVVQNRQVEVATDDDSIWRNVLNMYRRLESDEIPYAKIRAKFGELEQTLTADDEGYFLVVFELDEPLSEETNWREIELFYEDEHRQAQATGRVMIPPHSARLGVISDLDDTVIKTDVINLLKLARNTFFENAHTRLPFHGVAEFYTALQKAGGTFNPIFYVSNSPYNLYDLLNDFFTVRGIPSGPIFLRDMGLTETHLLASHDHKYERIEHLLAMYPDLPFILIGDSGEKDAAIYLQAVQKYPQRIKAVYIRDVEPYKPDTKRNEKVRQLAQLSQAAGVEMLLVADTAEAARHAVKIGLIAESTLAGIINAVSDDEQPNAVEMLIEEATDET
jgi:phosphatidate phosphatase APP1